MQVAAMRPLYTDRSNVNTEAIEKEIEIYKEQAINEGKKPEIAEKIATGRLEKYYQENCLVEQAFVKDGNKTIKDVLKDISATEGNDVALVSFTRYFLGEE
jgi:elongation factor Ts